ncbi:hypothetical protein Tco_0933753 [Tanacetum coccineum]
MTELKECMEKAHAESSLAKPNTNDDMNIELSKEFLMEIRSNAYHGMFDEDVVDHIAKWWINEGEGKITTWEDLVENFFINSTPNPAMAKTKCWMKVITEGLIYSNSCPGWNKRPMNDIVSNDEEWEESDYGNPPSTTIDSFLKPYLKAQEINDIEKRVNGAK